MEYRALCSQVREAAPTPLAVGGPPQTRERRHEEVARWELPRRLLGRRASYHFSFSGRPARRPRAARTRPTTMNAAPGALPVSIQAVQGAAAGLRSRAATAPAASAPRVTAPGVLPLAIRRGTCQTWASA